MTTRLTTSADISSLLLLPIMLWFDLHDLIFLVEDLCKTWTRDWTRLWTGLDWTDQNSCIQTANATKATKACPQLCLKLLSCCWVLEALSSQFLRGQRLRAYLISVNKGGSGQLLVGSVKVWASITCIYCFLWRPHASVDKAPPIFELWIERFAHLKD